MYNKLFSKILDSSIWLEDGPTRLVWLTFLAAMDQDGLAVFAAIPNLAHRARVTVEEATVAVGILESPDENSSNPDHEGRRIERVPGGWMILNSKTYQDLVTKAIAREHNRIRVQRHRKNKRALAAPGNASSNGVQRSGNGAYESVTQSDSDSDSDSDSEGENARGATPTPPTAEIDVTDIIGSVTPPTSGDDDRWRYERVAPWANGLKDAGCKIGPGNWRSWKRLVDAHGKRVLEVASKLPADERWDDKVEVALAKPSMEPDRADAYAKRWAERTVMSSDEEVTRG